MEKLGFLDQEVKKNKFDRGFRILTAAVLSLGFFGWFLTMFSIYWSIPTMFSGGFAGGLVTVWNNICDTFGSTQYIILNKVNGASGNPGLFITISFIVATMLNYFILQAKKTWPLIIYVLPFLFLSIFFDLSVDMVTFMTLCIAVIVAIAYVKNGYRIVAGALILALVLALITGFVSGTITFGRYVNNFKPAVNLRANTRIAIDKAYYGENPLDDGNLNTAKREDGKGTALEVTMSKPQSMYLKGFTGDLVDGTKWASVPNSYYYSSYPLAYDLKENGFNGVGQLAQAASFTKTDIGENKIDIKAKKASKEFAYVPYDLTKLGDLDEYNIKGASEIYGGKTGKFKKYSYTASDNQVEVWTDVAGAFFAKKPPTRELRRGKAKYLDNESYYNKFVYETYTYLNPMDKSAVSAALGQYVPREDGHEDYKTAIEKIKTYLKDDFVYSDKVNKDAITAQSIITGKSGFDVQYATAAVMMFRYYGIPARYAEGFLITPDDVKNVKPGETLEVPMSRAHAWPEIYIDGIGFVPIEVCPKYDGLMKEADLTVGISNSTRLQATAQNTSKLEEMFMDNQQQDNGGSASMSMWLLLLIIAVALIVLRLLYKLVIFLIGIIGSYMAMRKLFYKEEPKVAVSGIYEYMCRREYPINEFVRENGNKAAYSREPVGEDTRTAMLEEFKKGKAAHKEIVKAQKKAGKRKAAKGGEI